MITVDTSDLQPLADMYDTAPARAVAELDAVLERGALNVKNEARSAVEAAISGTYLPHYSRSMSYDVKTSADVLEAEIGPDADMPQGGMGEGVEFGSVNTAPIPHLIPAWEAEQPKLGEHAADALWRSLL